MSEKPEKEPGGGGLIVVALAAMAACCLAPILLVGSATGAGGIFGWLSGGDVWAVVGVAAAAGLLVYAAWRLRKSSHASLSSRNGDRRRAARPR